MEFFSLIIDVIVTFYALGSIVRELDEIVRGIFGPFYSLAENKKAGPRPSVHYVCNRWVLYFFLLIISVLIVTCIIHLF